MAGYKVHVAKDGEIGLEIFRNELVDLVVLDYDMPGMMGDDVAREMRRLRKDVPLLLVTAFHDLPQLAPRFSMPQLQRVSRPHSFWKR